MLRKEILKELEDYVERHIFTIEYSLQEAEQFFSSRDVISHELENFIIDKRKPSFAQVLFRYIDKKGCSDSEIYKKAGIDRRHFSKIRSNPDYRLGKHSAIALAIALELSKKETEKLLSSAGFALSDHDTFDLVIQFCLEKKIYDIDHVNQALDHLKLKTLTRLE